MPSVYCVASVNISESSKKSPTVSLLKSPTSIPVPYLITTLANDVLSHSASLPFLPAYIPYVRISSLLVVSYPIYGLLAALTIPSPVLFALSMSIRRYITHESSFKKSASLIRATSPFLSGKSTCN